MSGISSKALNFGAPENKYKYNGIEKENDLQIEIYDAQLRELDGQIGRWWEVDPKTENMEMWSPYVSNYDNPITYSDPLGDEGKDCCFGLENILVPLAAKAAEKPNGAAAVTLGIIGGIGNFVVGTVTAPINAFKGPSPFISQEAIQNGINLGVGVSQRIDAIKNGSTVDKTAAITETVLDVGALIVGARGLFKSGPEGIVYERIDKTGNISKPYIGQTKSAERFAARQKEHARANPNSDFEFKIIDRGKPGKKLDIKEQRSLDNSGGPTNKSNRNGGTSNKRNVIKKENNQ